MVFLGVLNKFPIISTHVPPSGFPNNYELMLLIFHTWECGLHQILKWVSRVDKITSGK